MQKQKGATVAGLRVGACLFALVREGDQIVLMDIDKERFDEVCSFYRADIDGINLRTQRLNIVTVSNYENKEGNMEGTRIGAYMYALIDREGRIVMAEQDEERFDALRIIDYDPRRCEKCAALQKVMIQLAPVDTNKGEVTAEYPKIKQPSKRLTFAEAEQILVTAIPRIEECFEYRKKTLGKVLDEDFSVEKHLYLYRGELRKVLELLTHYRKMLKMAKKEKPAFEGD